MRAAIYARYSTDLQSVSSIEDQVRSCRKLISAQDWQEVGVYDDAALSGTSVLRPGYQRMLADARNGQFDVLVSEALDRLSPDQEDIAGLYKQLNFLGVKLFTLSEGEVNELHVGLKGTMNALYVKDLSIKTRRGLEGRVRQGKSGGGNAFGYDVVKNSDATGEPIRGERSINEREAAIVRRIFEMFSQGHSPRAITKTLNGEGVPGPKGRPWQDTTIAAMPPGARAFCAMICIRESWCGTNRLTSKTHKRENALLVRTHRKPGSSKMCPICALSMINCGSGCKSASTPSVPRTPSPRCGAPSFGNIDARSTC